MGDVFGGGEGGELLWRILITAVVFWFFGFC